MDESQINSLTKELNDGNSESGLFLGDYYRELGQHELAFDYYLKSANLGNSDAQYRLGKAYDEGLGVQQSYSDSFQWFLLSANNNNPNGINAVGVCYDFGEGVIQSHE